MSSNRLPSPDRIQSEVESIIATLQKVPADYRFAYHYGHDRKYQEQGIDTQGARASKGSHSDTTAGIALGQMETRRTLRSVAELILGTASIKRQVGTMFTRLQSIFDSESDFDRPLRSLEISQSAGELDRKLARAYQEDRELQERLDLLETERRSKALIIATLQRAKDAAAKAEHRTVKRWLA